VKFVVLGFDLGPQPGKNAGGWVFSGWDEWEIPGVNGRWEMGDMGMVGGQQSHSPLECPQ